MTPKRFKAITSCYPRLRLVVAGDFCLDRYLEIDPNLKETSIETGLPVHNVVHVRSQPGGAGTILNNLVALGIGLIQPVGFAGQDGEGMELARALARCPGVTMRGFLQTGLRRTFTYCKPLVINPGRAPKELSRLDTKNWTSTPVKVQRQLGELLERCLRDADGLVVLDQVDVPNTGVITARLLRQVARLRRETPRKVVLADCRRGLANYPPVCFKMNQAELGALAGGKRLSSVRSIAAAAGAMARRHGRPVVVTLAGRGMLGADPEGNVEHVAALPVSGPIDIVGAGDAVTANLVAAFAAGATVGEAIQLANAAASVVVHQLGTTGTASVKQIQTALRRSRKF